MATSEAFYNNATSSLEPADMSDILEHYDRDALRQDPDVFASAFNRAVGVTHSDAEIEAARRFQMQEFKRAGMTGRPTMNGDWHEPRQQKQNDEPVPLNEWDLDEADVYAYGVR